MNRIINGVQYDTTTAHLMGVWPEHCNGDCASTEDLYRTDCGQMFLHVRDNNVENIIPLSNEDAQNWAREKMTEDDFFFHFCDTDSSDKKSLTLSVSNLCLRKLERIHDTTGKTISAIVEEMTRVHGR